MPGVDSDWKAQWARQETEDAILDALWPQLDASHKAAWALSRIVDATRGVGPAWETLPFSQKEKIVAEWAALIAENPTTAAERIHENLLVNPQIGLEYGALPPAFHESRRAIFRYRIEEIIEEKSQPSG